MEAVNESRESYDELDKMEEWTDDDEFVMLMMFDGVFLLEFLSISRGHQNNKDYGSNDPIFGVDGYRLIYDSLMQDLLLLENQLPYLVLYTLLSVSRELPDQSVKSILSWLMFAPKCDPGLHLLDMYMKGLLRDGQYTTNWDEMIVKHSASELHRCGIQFKGVQSVHGIEFDMTTATLKLPPIIINKQTLSTVLNLKAYETRMGKNREYNSYIHLINSLVESSKDVMWLQSKGIIVNAFGSYEVVADIVKEFSKNTVVDMNSMSAVVVQQMDKYYNKNTKKKCWRLLR